LKTPKEPHDTNHI